MLFTHHSHSGQFCTHATSTLEEVIQTALARGLTSIALTEHIPRDPIDHYPGEADLPVLAGRDLWALFDAYYAEACRLRDLYAGRIEVLVGFEGEWVRTPRSGEIIGDLLGKYDFDVWIGSVHHVHAVPVDFTGGEYRRARDVAGGTDEALAGDYYDAQWEMLRELRPPIVGHFDLIRLMADEGNRDRDWREWGKGLWGKIVRNLKVVTEYGGVLEVNSAALRKGLKDVYPRREILQEFLAMGGKFTLSDDSHGVEQICTHYNQALECIQKAGISELWYASRHGGLAARTEWKSSSLSDVKSRMEAMQA